MPTDPGHGRYLVSVPLLPPLRVLAVLGLLAAASCVFVAGAAVGAGAVYALGTDSVEVYLEAPIAQAHAVAAEELRQHGTLILDDPGAKSGTLTAEVAGSKIEIALTAVMPGTTRAVVRARKWKTLAPDLESAERIADRIALRVKG